MHFEKRLTGGHIVLDPGDHKLLKVSEAVSAIPVDSDQLAEIVKDLELGIEMGELVLEGYRRSRNAFMFEVHGEIMAMHGLLHEIERCRSRERHPSATTQFDSELWGPLHDEPVGQQPTLTLFTNSEPGFDPSGPSIA